MNHHPQPTESANTKFCANKTRENPNRDRRSFPKGRSFTPITAGEIRRLMQTQQPKPTAKIS